MNNKWHKRFLELAKQTASYSKDPSSKIGAVIVDPKTKAVVSMGYNGFPRGVKDTEERLNNRDTKLKLVVHAELNAIINAKRSVEGCYMYVWPTLMVPNSCPDCSKAIAQAGIAAVYYEKNDNTAERWQQLSEFSRTILEESGVKFEGIE